MGFRGLGSGPRGPWGTFLVTNTAYCLAPLLPPCGASPIPGLVATVLAPGPCSSLGSDTNPHFSNADPTPPKAERKATVKHSVILKSYL